MPGSSQKGGPGHFLGAAGQFKSARDKWQTSNVANHAFIEYDIVKTPQGQEIATPPQRQTPPMGSPLSIGASSVGPPAVLNAPIT
jgi:hypothetical protein